MTIRVVPNMVIIRHEDVGFNLSVQQLPYMSMETALWLEAHLIAELSAEHGIFDTSDILTSLDPWVLRARAACDRAYRPSLCDKDGQLTETGRIVAKQANKVLNEIRDIDPERCEPQNWMRIDDILLNADIPSRVILLLKIMHRALEDTQSRIDAGTWTPPSGDAPTNSNLDNEEFNNDTPDGVVDVDTSHIFSKIVGTHQPDIATDVLWSRTQGLTVLVPMHKLLAKAKYDVRTLVLYGLVDLRLIHGYGRGRPKIGITVSDPGRLLLKNLESIPVQSGR